MKHYIYAYVDPRDNVVRYIGQGGGERWLTTHKNGKHQGVYPWLQELKLQGLEPIRFIVLDKLTKPQVDRWEIDLIDFIGRQIEQTGPLLNLSSGGGGNKGCRHGSETRRKMSHDRKGIVPSDRTLQAAADSHRGKPLSVSVKMKIALSNRGNTNAKGSLRSEKQKREMSNARKGKPKSAETRKKMSEARHKYLETQNLSI